MRFIYDEDGQAMVEYVLVAAILIAASYGALRLFAVSWHMKFQRTANARTGILGIRP